MLNERSAANSKSQGALSIIEKHTSIITKPLSELNSTENKNE